MEKDKLILKYVEKDQEKTYELMKEGASGSTKLFLIGIALLICGAVGLYLAINRMIQLHEQGFFAEDAYARGLYHYPEETKDDLMLSGVITIGISAALFAFGIYNIVCGVMTEAKKAKS